MMLEEKEDNALIRRILTCCYTVHRELGPGYPETTYQRALLREMENAGLVFTWEVWLPVSYLGEEIDRVHADFIVESILLEVSAEHSVSREETTRAFAGLRVSGLNRGLLVGFGAEELQVKRIAMPPRQLTAPADS